MVLAPPNSALAAWVRQLKPSASTSASESARRSAADLTRPQMRLFSELSPQLPNDAILTADCPGLLVAGGHPGRPGSAGNRRHESVLHRSHGLCRHRGEVRPIRPRLLKVDFLQGQHIRIEAANAVTQPLRIHAVADGAAVQNVKSGYAHTFSGERIEKLLARSATWVTGESAADVDALTRLRRSRACVSALTSGVDVDRFTPVGPALARTGLHRVLCLAPNPLWSNGFDIAIIVLPRVPDTELVLAETDAGNRTHDEARARLRHLATGLGVADRVRFAGTVADAELPMLMRSADVVACTPRQPPRATTVLPAMSSGVVVVALSVGVLNDAVVDNVTGLVLSPESPAGLTAALRSLLVQSFQCESMSAAGRARALSRFAWDRIALDALNVYRQLGAQRWVLPDLQSTGGPVVQS